MPGTTIADLQLVPNKFSEYVNEQATAKSALIRSGVAVSVPRVSELINATPKGGNMITLPFYKPLAGEDEVFGEEEMALDKVTTGAQVAPLLIRQKAWSDTDLAKVLGGTDPIGAIAGMIADWWIEREQAIMLSVLGGIVGGKTAALKDHILDISESEGTDSMICYDATLDAKQLMGDASDKIGAIAMHSATKTALKKLGQIESDFDSAVGVKIDRYDGCEIIVDDSLPVADGVYTTYLLGKGSFARDDGMPDGLVGTETDRKKLSSTNILINRRAFIMHPLGMRFKSDATFAGGKQYAANSDLAKVANWSAAYNLKNIPIVALKHRIAPKPSV